MTLSGFLRAYEPSWGRLKYITHPTIGNHEGSGESYYRYFGSTAGRTGSGTISPYPAILDPTSHRYFPRALS